MHRNLDTHADLIARALRNEGGHFSVGRGASRSASTGTVTGRAAMRSISWAACRAAGLRVIDSRPVSFERLTTLAVSGPMIAVGEPFGPLPDHDLTYAALAVVAAAYRAAGAAMFKLDPVEPGTALRGRGRQGLRDDAR